MMKNIYNPIDQRLNWQWCGSCCISNDHKKWKKRALHIIFKPNAKNGYHVRLACACLYAPTNLFVRDHVLIKSKCLLVFTNGAIFACNNQNVNRHENPHEHEHDSQMLSITWWKLLNDLVSLAKATLSSIDRANRKKRRKKEYKLMKNLNRIYGCVSWLKAF